jgi:hypothetical protein
MEYTVAAAARILVSTPDVVRRLLGEAGAEWTLTNYGTGTFSPFDVLGHLIHGERTDWIPRARLILESGETRPFPTFDRFAMLEMSKEKTLPQLLDEFETLRSQSVRSLRELSLTQDDLKKTGMHPTLGRVTLANHLAMWVVHDLGHLAQIARSMAWQYRDQIGPWLNSTSILQHDRGAL